MSDLSAYAVTLAYNRIVKTDPVYLALYTDAEGTEVAVAGYARQAVTFSVEVGGLGQNENVLTFGPLSGSGTVTHGALVDDVGNALTVVKPLAASRTWGSGDSIQFAAGDVDFGIE